MQASPRFVFAFQLALALVIGYWLALSFDWERPRWTAFAIIAVAVPHIGMSLGRAGQRLLGTFVGSSMALVIVGLFPQDRWPFILCLSSWLAICTYMMVFSRRSYFWHCAGFICSIIAASAANVGGDSFMLAVDRTLETSLGIVVYTVVALLVWRQPVPDTPPPSLVGPWFFPDMDAVVAALRVFIIYWVSFLAIVYIPDFPTGLAFLAPMGPLAMAIAASPQLPIRALYLPVVLGLFIASLIYMLVMPILSSYAELAALIFVYALAVGYRFYAPAETLARLIVLFIFGGLVGISNDQAYTFGAVSNNMMNWLWVLIMLHVSTILPVNIWPESKFLRLLERFQYSTALLNEPPAAKHWLARWQRAYHRHEILTIPNKLAMWQPRLSPQFSGTSGEEVQQLLDTVKACSAALLESEAQAAKQAELEALQQHCAMINWSPWRESRF
jgi:uncharacterized membrane protein YccC